MPNIKCFNAISPTLQTFLNEERRRNNFELYICKIRVFYCFSLQQKRKFSLEIESIESSKNWIEKTGNCLTITFLRNKGKKLKIIHICLKSCVFPITPFGTYLGLSDNNTFINSLD